MIDVAYVQRMARYNRWQNQNLYGVADQFGSIAPGKEASLFTTTGDALDIRSRVTGVWIKGAPTDLKNRQTQLWDRYRSRPQAK